MEEAQEFCTNQVVGSWEDESFCFASLAFSLQGLLFQSLSPTASKTQGELAPLTSAPLRLPWLSQTVPDTHAFFLFHPFRPPVYSVSLLIAR